MNTHIQKASPTLMWAAAIALIIFSIVGVAAFMGWIPNSMGSAGSEDAPAKASIKTNKSNTHVSNDSVSTSRPKAICAECGVVQSTREIAQPGDGGAVGIVGGAVVGGLLGNQVGKGRGKDVATVAGAVGGAVVGNEIEKRVDTTKRYETSVRFNDGSSRVFTQAQPTPWRSGDQVKLVDGVLRANN